MEKLNINGKMDRVSSDIGRVSADEFNRLVGKINELVEGSNAGKEERDAFLAAYNDAVNALKDKNTEAVQRMDSLESFVRNNASVLKAISADDYDKLEKSGQLDENVWYFIEEE